ncbi:hypothetical protein BDR05DRAFT_953867, partial [Suillus weaverae]
MPPPERSVEGNASRIMEKIIDCGILDSSPSMSRASRILRYTVNYAVDDGWNTEDGDNEELLAAINSCGILQPSLNHTIEHKRPRGRPKKKVIKRTGTYHKQMFATHEVESSTQTRMQPNRGKKHIIHATTTTVLETPLVQQQEEHSHPYVDASSLRLKGAYSHRGPTSHHGEGITRDKDMCIEFQTARAACGVFNKGEVANSRAVTLTKQPNDARRQWGHSETIRQCDTRDTEPMHVAGQGKTHNLGHGVEREAIHTINCRPEWDGTRDLMASGEIAPRGSCNGIKDDVYDDEGMTVEDDITELQAALAACGIMAEGEAAHGRSGVVVKQTNQTKRQRGRPKKKRVRRQDTTDSGNIELMHAITNNVMITAQDSESHNGIQDYNHMENDILEGGHHHDTAEGYIDDDYRPTPIPPCENMRPISPQRLPTPPILLSPEDIASRALARPLRWMHAVENLPTLLVNTWLDSQVANYYLAHAWYDRLGRSKVRFVDMFAAAGTATEWTDDELKFFRLDHFVTEGQCPMVPVGFIVHCINHFFAVIFDYNRRTAHVLGRFISVEGITAAAEGGQNNPNDWNSWDGPRRWGSIAVLHGWRPGDSDDVRIIAKNWIQNGVDCGPIACSVLEQALSSGLDDNGDLPLQSFHIPCGHILRIAMLKVIAGRIKKSCSDYLMFQDEQQAETEHYSILSDDEIHAIHTGQHQARATCQSCHRHHAFQVIQTPNSANRHVDDDHARNATSEVEEEEDDEADNQSLGDKLSGIRKENLVKLLKSNKELVGSHDRNAISRRAVGTHIPVAPNEPPQLSHTGDLQRSAFARASRKKVSTWSQGIMERFPRPTKPVPLSAYTGRRWLTDDRTFDDYEGGPTIEMLIPPIYVQPTMTYHSTGMELSAGWASWVDHGYRIRPSSFQMFYLCRPIETMEHIMPIGTTEFYDPSNQVPDRVTGEYSLERSYSNHTVAVNDVIYMSASEMIRSAKDDPPLDQPSASGHDIFICGRTSFSDGAKYICVDLEQDSVAVDVDDVEVSVDIDSIIWTTSEFRLKGTVGIYMTPLFQSRPGIFKHNHVSIDILIPQSEEDFHAPGGRTEWLSKQFNMSAIPHICIGRISSASSILNLYMMFPRMIHRHPINGRMITLMPHDVIDIFYDMVLLPSIGHFNDISWDPYLKQTLEEARYKTRGASGRPGGRGAPKIIPLSNDDFMR